jgi:hypothetical protein
MRRKLVRLSALVAATMVISAPIPAATARAETLIPAATNAASERVAAPRIGPRSGRVLNQGGSRLERAGMRNARLARRCRRPS